MIFKKKLNLKTMEWEPCNIEIEDTPQTLFETDLRNESGGMATRLINKGTLGFSSFTAADARNP